MFALEPHSLRWLADELGVVAFSYDGERLAPFGREAERFLPGPTPLERARALLGDAFCPAEIDRAHREGANRTVAWGEGKAYVLPLGEVGLVVVHPEEAQSMQRAMAKHDTSHALGLVVAWSRVAESSDSGELENAMRGIRGAVEAARMALEGRPRAREITPVHEVVDEVLQLLEPLAAQRKLRVEASVPPDLEARAPRSVLYRALWNVVENAYSALGLEQSVRIEARRLDGRAEIRVIDDGPGVPEKLVPTLFTKRPEVGRSRGIGLSGVAESLVEVGGSIRLEPTHASGACFVIEVPLEPSLDRRRSGVLPKASGSRVLVVEDDSSLRDLLAATFELGGIAVETRRDDLPEDVRGFDAALVDLRLTTVDGVTLASELFRRGFSGSLHLMSGGEPPRAVDGALSFHFHRKPFDPTEVVESVRRSIREREAMPGPSSALR